MANDENKFLPIFQILDIKNVSFLLKLEMALATTIRMKFEPVWSRPAKYTKEGVDGGNVLFFKTHMDF